MFLPLTKDEIKQILELLLKKTRRMLAKQGMALELTDNAKDLLADLGYDPQFGARPLKRVLQKEVLNELSKHVLSGDFDGGDTIYIDTDAKGLTFENKPSGSSDKPKSNGAAKPVVERADKTKRLEDLKKATKEVEDAVRKANEKNGNADLNAKNN